MSISRDRGKKMETNEMRKPITYDNRHSLFRAIFDQLFVQYLLCYTTEKKSNNIFNSVISSQHHYHHYHHDHHHHYQQQRQNENKT